MGLALFGRSIHKPLYTSWKIGVRDGVWVKQDQQDSLLGSGHSSPVLPRFVG